MELDKAKKQLEELRRKVARLEPQRSQRTELERKMEATYAPAKKIDHQLTEIYVFVYVLDKNKKRAVEDLMCLNEEWEEVSREIGRLFVSVT